MLAVTTAALIVLLALGLPIAVVLGVLGLFIDFSFSRFPLNLALGEVFWQHSTEFILFAVPLFILMGEIILRAGIAGRMYGAMVEWLSWLPGGLMHANIGTCALFAATSGSSVATAATIGLTAIPQIKRHGYNERLFLGSLAAGGTLGILIPPSMNMIVYGFLTNTSVPRLFLAGIVPGLILTAMYMAVILICCLAWPDWGGRPHRGTWARRLAVLPDLLQPTVLFGVVLGSIYAGWATPTEAAALGVIVALAMAAWNDQLSWAMIGSVLESTVRTSAMVTLILIFAFFLNFAIASVGLVQQVNAFITGLGWSPTATLLLIIGLYIVMGMFMDALAMVVLTVPVMAPIVQGLGYDPVWFGILIVVLCETAILTPPVGMLCFVIQSIRREGALADVFYGIVPFLFALAALLAMMMIWPQLVLFIPQQVYP